MAARAGPTRYGYTEPTQVAWELLEEALEPWLEDIGRRVGLGLTHAAIVVAIGSITALGNVEGCDHDRLLLSWAPDFPAGGIDSVVDALERAGIDSEDQRIQAALVGPFCLRPCGSAGVGSVDLPMLSLQESRGTGCRSADTIDADLPRCRAQICRRRCSTP